MAVQTTEEFKNGGATSYAITIEYLKTSDIKVRIGGALQTYVASSPSSGEYTVSGTTVTLGAQAAAGSGNVHIYRDTDVNTAAAVFAAGSSIKAADLNALHDMARMGVAEARSKIITADIKEGQITSTEILDGTIVDADISGSAAIAQSKIATGNLPSGITVNSANIVDGSIVDADVSNSANISGTKLSDDSVTLAKLGSGALPTDITIASANIVNETIVNEDVNNSAAIAGTKISPNFGSQVVQTTGNIVVGGTVDGRDIATDGTKLDGIEVGATGDQTNAEIKTAYEANSNTNEFSDAEQTKLAGIETAATIDQTAAEIKTLLQSDKLTDSEITAGTLDNRYYTETELDAGQLDNRYYTEAELNGGQLNSLYFTESEITGGAADGRYYTETELDAGQLDNRYFTETELTSGALDGRYYTETEAEAKFLRQDSSETIASGVTWSNADDKVATTAAINARIIDLVDDIGGFTVIANETSFPNTNPQGGTGQAAIMSIGALTQAYTPSGTTVTIANGTVGNSTVTITGVPSVLPIGFGILVESTSTLNTYTFHRLVPKATEVTTVAGSITNINNCGNNLADIENFADLYQISTSAPTTRADGTALTIGDLWFDSSSNQVVMVYDGSSGDGFSPITPDQATITAINSVSGHVTFQEDLGLVTEAVNTGSGNNSINTVGANIAAVNTVAADLTEATSEIDTVATNIANVNTVGTAIANVNAVGTNISNVNAAATNASNINAAVANASNINSAVSNASNITTVAGSIADVNRYAAEYLIQSGNPSSPSAGDLWYNSTANTLNYYTGGTWVGIAPGIAGLINDASPALANHLDCNDKNLTEVGTVSGNNLQIDFGTL